MKLILFFLTDILFFGVRLRVILHSGKYGIINSQDVCWWKKKEVTLHGSSVLSPARSKYLKIKASGTTWHGNC